MNYGKEIYKSSRQSGKHQFVKSIRFKKSLTELVAEGDAEAIAMVARVQGLIRHFLIKRRILKD